MKTNLVDKKTKDNITIFKSLDGARNTTLFISGNIKNEIDSTFSVIDITELAGNPSSLRLDNICYMIEEGLKTIVTYKEEPYFIPLAGRGKFEVDKFGGICGHQILFTFKGVGTFFIGLDISKLGV